MTYATFRGVEDWYVPAETHTHKKPLSRDDVARIVVDSLADVLGVDASDLRESDDLGADLGVGSLELYRLAEAVEEEIGERTVGFRFDEDDLSELATVADTIDHVAARVA